jgi:hypothetical protein
MDPATPARRLFSCMPAYGLALVTLIALATACPKKQHEGPNVSEGGRSEVDWDQPITFGVPLVSLEGAQSSLPFSPRMPDGLGAPEKMFITANTVPEDGRAIAFEFRTQAYGRVLVVERLPDVPEGTYNEANRELVASNTGSSVLEIVFIREGTEALVVTSAEGRSAGIYWLEAPIEFWITGEDLIRGQVLEIANFV